MNREEEIVGILVKKFPFLQDRISVKKEKRIFTGALSRDEFEKIVRYVHGIIIHSFAVIADSKLYFVRRFNGPDCDMPIFR